MPAREVHSLVLPVWVQVYDIPLSPVQRMEQKVSVKLRKWLGVPRSFNTNALYVSSFNLSLPLNSLVEVSTVGKYARYDD